MAAGGQVAFLEAMPILEYAPGRMHSTLGSRGHGRHARRRSRLLATATVAACLGFVVVSAIGAPKTYGATNKATLPPLPICAFSFVSKYAPSAGDTVGYTLSFAICKSLNLSVEEVRPAGVTKIDSVASSDGSAAPTRWVHGSPVWVKNVSWRSYPTKTLRLTFAHSLHTGQKVQLKFIFRAHGYRTDVEVVTQTVYNP